MAARNGAEICIQGCSSLCGPRLALPLAKEASPLRGHLALGGGGRKPSPRCGGPRTAGRPRGGKEQNVGQARGRRSVKFTGARGRVVTFQEGGEGGGPALQKRCWGPRGRSGRRKEVAYPCFLSLPWHRGASVGQGGKTMGQQEGRAWQRGPSDVGSIKAGPCLRSLPLADACCLGRWPHTVDERKSEEKQPPCAARILG